MIHKASELQVEVRDRMRGGEGSVTIRHYFSPGEFTAKVRLCASLTIPVGAGIGPHVHDAEDEIYLVTRGSGLLDDGTKVSRIGVGDAVLTGKGGRHSVTNDGTEPLEITAVIVCYGT
jgi:mannose-6-phosphate isomerase-like protein (cupin superfamily)